MYENILKLAKTYEKLAKVAQTTKSTELGTLQDVMIEAKAVPLKEGTSAFDKKIDQGNPLFVKLFNEVAGMVEDTTKVSMSMVIAQNGRVSISIVGNGHPMKKPESVVAMEQACSSAIGHYLRKNNLKLESPKAWNNFINFNIQF